MRGRTKLLDNTNYLAGEIALRTAWSVSGRLLAAETVALQGQTWLRRTASCCMFHLTDQSREGLRAMAAQIHRFVSEQQIKTAAFCRTATGNMDDEARIEAVLLLIPGMETRVFDGDQVLRWASRERMPFPYNAERSQLSLPQLWAIDLAQRSLFAQTKETQLS